MADFLREIRDVTLVSRQFRQQVKSVEPIRRADVEAEKLPDLTLENAERALYVLENDEHSIHSSQRGVGEDGFDVDAGGELSHSSLTSIQPILHYQFGCLVKA